MDENAIPSQSGGEVYVFDSAGRHLRTLDATTGKTLLQFTYDGSGRLSSITDIDGNATRIERNAAGDATAIVAPFGQRTGVLLDGNGYLAVLSDPGGNDRSFVYGGGGLLARYTDPLGGVHAFTYDSGGRLLTDKDPGQGQQTLSRAGDASDSTVTLTTALGRTTGYRIQRLNTGDEVWSNTRDDGTQVSVRRNTDGSTASTFPDGTTLTEQVAPDPRFGMLAPIAASVTIRTPGGLVQTQSTTRAVTRLGSDPLALATATETFTLNGRTFTRLFDGRAKTITITSPLGRQTKATLNDQGRIATVTNPTVTAMQLIYDSAGRPTSVAQGERQRTLTYGSDGLISSASDALGRTTQFVRDPLGRVTQQHAPDSSLIEYGFDAASELLRVRPPGETDHRVERDIQGLITSYVAPDVGASTSRTTYAYNADHQLTSITDPDGSVLSLNFDAAGRTSRLATPDGAIDATYDTAGRLSSLDAAGGVELTLGYDGQLPTDVTWSGPVAGALHLAFDNDFRLASETVGGGPPIVAGYDADGLLISIGALTVSRDATTGRIKQTAIGSVVESYTFSALAELSSTATTCGGNPLRTSTLTRDAVGTITGKDETVLGQASSVTYDHDVMGRLTGVHGGSQASTYSYDSNGNRLTASRPDAVSYVYDAQDRLTQQGGTTYAYTAAGQLASRTDPSGVTNYHYDLLGNLRTVQPPDGRSIAYVIDGLNRRIGKTIDGAATQGFLYDSATTIVAELDGAGNVVSRFVYGTRSNVPDYMIKAGATYRILSDAVGSPQLVVDTATCEIAEQIDYDEFGRVVADSNPGFQPFGFAGGLSDRDTGLIRFGARDYGDTISFGFTRWVRKKLGVDQVVNPCAGLYTAGGVAAMVVGTLASGGAGAAEDAASVSRGLSQYRGIFSSVKNAAGGEVWTSAGEIAQKDFATYVNSALMRDEEVNILTGAHGLADGALKADRTLYEADVAAFGEYPGVTVRDITSMSASEIGSVVNGPGTIIGGFCNSGACLAPFL